MAHDTNTATAGPRKMLSMSQVLAIVPFSRRTLYRRWTMGASRRRAKSRLAGWLGMRTV